MIKYVKIFKTQDDLYFNFNKNTKMIILTGMSGSGKSYTSYGIAKKYNYSLFSIDFIFDYEDREMNNFEKTIVTGFIKKYPQYGNFINNRTKTFEVCNKLFDYIDNYIINKRTQIILDSAYFYKTILPYKFCNQRIIIKRTSLVKSIYNATKRDIKRTWKKDIFILKRIYFICKIYLYILLDIYNTIKNYIQLNVFIDRINKNVNK